MVISVSADVGCLYGQYKRLNQFDAGVLTGKPLGFGIRPEATGYGLVYYTEERNAQSAGNSFAGRGGYSGSVAWLNTLFKKLLNLVLLLSLYLTQTTAIDKMLSTFSNFLQMLKKNAVSFD